MRHPKPNAKTQQQKRSRRMREYKKAREEYLHEVFFCEICRDIATEIHHRAGRIGRNLTDKNNFLAVCKPCHALIHSEPKLALEKGWSEKK